MNPDQTAPLEQSDLGPYCLQYRRSKNLSRRESRQQQKPRLYFGNKHYES